MDPEPGAASHPFSRLEPDVILDAVESTGVRCDGRLLALNSYENRVYQVGVEDAPPVVAKFYRPERWSDAAILEEHAFAAELVAAELPVVGPFAEAGGNTLHEHAGFRFAIFPRRGGRAPELDRDDTLRRIGMFIGRIHAVGAKRRFTQRESVTVEAFGSGSVAWLLAHEFLPADLLPAYRAVSTQALEAVEACFERAGTVATLRLHGDCHAGNVLWTDDGPHFVDLDDCRQGPAVQDLWMLLSGDRAEQGSQVTIVLEGYETFRPFDRTELTLIEALRTLRVIQHAAWLARRWDDPAFPASFPWFNTQRYWQDHVLALREQVALMSEPPLVVPPARGR